MPGNPRSEPFEILLVEDNPADTYLVHEALREQELNIELHVVNNGEKAIAFIDRADSDGAAPCPRLLLLDLNLPRRSGEEVLQRVRKSSRCAQIPVIVLTSSDSPRDREKAAGFGITHYFRKPTDLDAFMRLGELVKGLVSRPEP